MGGGAEGESDASTPETIDDIITDLGIVLVVDRHIVLDLIVFILV